MRVLGGDVRRTSRLLTAGHSKSWRWCWFCLSSYRCVLLSLCTGCRTSACTGCRLLSFFLSVFEQRSPTLGICCLRKGDEQYDDRSRCNDHAIASIKQAHKTNTKHHKQTKNGKRLSDARSNKQNRTRKHKDNQKHNKHNNNQQDRAASNPRKRTAEV